MFLQEAIIGSAWVIADCQDYIFSILSRFTFQAELLFQGPHKDPSRKALMIDGDSTGSKL